MPESEEGVRTAARPGRSFARLVVVEAGGAPAGAYCGKLFADHGARVTVIGDGPRGPGAAFYDSAKRRVGQQPGRSEQHEELLAAADVIIQADAIDAIADPIEPRTSDQVVVRISPFGSSGPYAGWRSTDLVDSAIAGHLRLSGDPEREPLQGVPDLVHHGAGVAAFVAAVAALVARVRTGSGQIVETSHQEVITALHQFTLCRYTHNGAVLQRHGNRYAGPGSPIGAYECRDGWIGLALPQGDQLERMLDVTGLVTLLDRPDVDSIWDLMTVPGLLDAELVPYLKTQSRDETVELFQALRLPCAPIADLHDVLADPHLDARAFWHPLGDRVGADDDPVLIPGPPFRMSGHDWSPHPEPTVRHGSGPRGGAGARGESGAPGERLPHGSESVTDLADGPLTGLRVIDMTRVWAGPLAARLLADLGAEVIMTEVPWTRTPREVPQSYVDGTHFFPDDDGGTEPWNRTGFHNKYAINKLSTVVELDKPEGRDLFAALVPTADVVIENYSPRVMPGFGFEAEHLRELNPDLIYVTMPGYGRSGPYTDWVAYGPTIDGHVGHTALTGYRNEGPWKCGIAWPDPIGGLHGAAAAVVALLDRFVEPDDGGQTVEVAQVEAAVNMIGQHLVAAQETGRSPARLGNRRADRAPQGVYRCAGEDRWIAISVVDDQSWRALCHQADLSDLAMLSLAERLARHDELDHRIGRFTAAFDDRELMHRLQAAGVPAGAVLDAADVMADQQLAALDFFAEVDHPVAGSHRWPRFPVRLSATPATVRCHAPLMGQHNEYAVIELAGYDADRYASLLAAGIVRTTPPH